MPGVVEKTLNQKDGYTIDQIASVLGMPVEQLKTEYMSKFPIRANVFHLYRRAMHVFTEALRVFQFRDICLSASPDAYLKLGELMNSSQTSCRDLFDCSCPELDELATIAR